MTEQSGNPPTSMAGPEGSAVAPIVSSGSTTTDVDPRQLQTQPPVTTATPVQATGAGEQLWNFGRYRVERRLGHGGMGEVFLAQDAQLQRTVALKIPRLADDRPALRSRFLREARAAASLSHPNICPVFDADEIDGRPYLTMAFIDGAPLSVRLGQLGRFAPADAAALVKKVAQAMQHAHDKGILHRDLKPANILLNSRDEPIVTDFGLAFRLDTDTSERLTEQGLLVGTPSYMPPEQINAQELRPTADVYSLGMVLYELLTGSVAFNAPLGKLLAQIETAAPAPPSQLRPGLSPLLDAICLKALAKRPQDRFATMADLAQALEDYAAGRENLDLSAATVVFRRPRRRRRWLAVAATALSVAVAITLFLLIRRERPIEETEGSVAEMPATKAPAPANPEFVLELDQKRMDFKLLLAQLQRPILRIEAVASANAPLHLARSTIPEKLLRDHKGPLALAVTGSGGGHVVDLSDQAGQDLQLTDFSAGEMTLLGPNISFLNKLGKGARVFLKGGPGYSILAPLQDGRGSKHVEFEGTHLLLSKKQTPTIGSRAATAQERTTLGNAKLTQRIVVSYELCDYVIYTMPGVEVVPSDAERPIKFPAIHNMIELDRERQFKARIITAEKLRQAIDEANKK